MKKYSIKSADFQAFFEVYKGKYASRREAWIDWNLLYGRDVYATQHKPCKEIIVIRSTEDYREKNCGELTGWKAVSAKSTLKKMVA